MSGKHCQVPAGNNLLRILKVCNMMRYMSYQAQVWQHDHISALMHLAGNVNASCIFAECIRFFLWCLLGRIGNWRLMQEWQGLQSKASACWCGMLMTCQLSCWPCSFHDHWTVWEAFDKNKSEAMTSCIQAHE